MKLFLLLIASSWVFLASADDDPCERNVDVDALKAVAIFGIKIFRLGAQHYQNQFVMSSYGIYLALAATAEGATGDARNEIFDVLGLPQEKCLRDKYYEYILSAEPSSPSLWKPQDYLRTRALVVDDSFKINSTWAEDVRMHGLLNYVLPLPLRGNKEEAFDSLNGLFHKQIGNLELDGNTLIDSIDYDLIWQVEFPEAYIQHGAEFYDDSGREIGRVDLMRFKKSVRIAYLERYNAKVLVLPVGEDGRYNMMFLLNIDSTPLEQTVASLDEGIIDLVVNNMKKSEIPIDVAIPRFSMESNRQDSLKLLLERMGVKKLWSDPEGSELISSPPAVPSAFYQRVKFNVGPKGALRYYGPASLGNISYLDGGMVNFIANRPFAYALVDSSTKVRLFCGGYSGPEIRRGHQT